MQSHIRTLAWLHIVLSSLLVLAGLGVFLLSAGIAGIAASGGHNALPFASIIATSGTLILLVFAAFALPGFLLAWGLMHHAHWARPLGFVMSAFSLIHPTLIIGIAVGIYGLWILLQPEAETVLNT